MMRPERRGLLDRHVLLFSSQLHVEMMIEILLKKDVFNENVVDTIKSRHSERERRKEVIRAVQRRGDVAFDAFYQALLECGHVELAALLEPLVVEAERSRNTFSPESNYDTIRASRCPTSPPAYGAPTPRTHRDSISSNSSSLSLSFHDPRDRSRSRSRALLSSDRYNHAVPPVVPQFVSIFKEPALPSPRRSANGAYGYSTRSVTALQQKVPMEYVFHEESMNYVDAPFVQRAFDRETMYPNFSNPRGLCLIINNEYFDEMPTRNGTKTDKENISNLFRCMGYTIICKDNLTSREVLMTVHDFTKNPSHRRCDSAIIVILSHGEENQIIGVDDKSVSTHDIYDLLSASKAPLLANKPKLVFVQACRGERRDTGFPVLDATDGIPALLRRNRDKGDGPLFNFFGCVRPQLGQTMRKKPDQADILIAYATTAQFVSWRNSVRGSWFIQAICEVFSRKATEMDVVEMLTEVNKRVACGFQTSQGATTLKQMPEMTSRLVKKFYFWPRRDSAV